MSKDEGQIKGILAYVTTDKHRFLGGTALALLAKNQDELIDISNNLAEVFLADILELKNGDHIIIKK
ncbi:capping complex subunit for YIEGIA [Alkalihalobacillus sp. 1P02AB]|uniref:capping complex subunit for YIEGIA n=1 Tax=Alkalihalobacillus sp. 1P02AB TaxID=3132260 RepID=UPI0039A4C5BF